MIKENDRFIGDCGITLQNIDGDEVFEIGYHCNKKYWNNGYVTEAVQAFIDYLFNNSDIKKHDCSDIVFFFSYVGIIGAFSFKNSIFVIFGICQ